MDIEDEQYPDTYVFDLYKIKKHHKIEYKDL